MTRAFVLLAVAGSCILGGCGKVGTLDQPAPLFGEKAKARYQAQKAAAAAAARSRGDDDQIEALPGDKRYDPNADPGPSRALPIPGAHATPNGAPPEGVLPDPYNHPQ